MDRGPWGDGDELVSGSQRDPLRLPPRVRVLLVAVLLVGVVVAAVAALGPGRTPARVAAPPAPVSTAAAPTYRPPRAALSVDEVCPVRTDGRSMLTVSFTVINWSQVPAALIAAEPRLPLGGLEPDGASLGGGTCASPQPEPPADLRLDGPALLVSFRFRLPPECPQPFPVQATVFAREDRIRSTVLPVLDDLGGTDFETCPRPG